MQHLGKKQAAEHCYRQYVDLLLAGIAGTYPVDAVMRRMRELHAAKKNGAARDELHKVVSTALRASGVEQTRRRGRPPRIDFRRLLSRRRVATKL